MQKETSEVRKNLMQWLKIVISRKDLKGNVEYSFFQNNNEIKNESLNSLHQINRNYIL